MKRSYDYIFKKIEGLLLIITVISFVLLIFFQIIGSNNDYASVFSNSGTFLNVIESDNGIIIFSIDNPKFSKVEIIKNGEIIKKFNSEKELVIRVNHKDILEINGTMYQDIVKLKIVGVSKNIAYPKLNQLVQTSKSIELIGQVNLK